MALHEKKKKKKKKEKGKILKFNLDISELCCFLDHVDTFSTQNVLYVTPLTMPFTAVLFCFVLLLRFFSG